MQRKRLVENILPHVDRTFVLNPELVRFVPDATFLPYASVDLERFEVRLPKTTGRIRVVHAPSDPTIKGSRYIIEAIETLQQDFEIDFELVQGLPHEKALAVYGRADLIIDQVLAGWYGGLAVEAMAMGKPVACYIREADLGAIPAGMRAELPLLNISLRSLEMDLRNILKRRNEWPDIARRSREFVMKWHNPSGIANALIETYEDPECFDLSKWLA
jgi:hypothetical protein